MCFVNVTTSRDYEERKDRPGLRCDKLQCDHQVRRMKYQREESRNHRRNRISMSEILKSKKISVLRRTEHSTMQKLPKS